MKDAVTKAATSIGETGCPLRFILSEWRRVVDAWQLDGIEAYARVPCLGRKSRMSAGQRERLWPVFAAATRASLAKRGLLTWPEIFGGATACSRTGQGGSGPFQPGPIAHEDADVGR